MSDTANSAAKKPAMRREEQLLEDLRAGRPMPAKARVSLVLRLGIPTVLAEISTILMEYIDAGMVGRLGAGCAAAVGLVASSTWLFWGLLRGAVTGFAVQIAQDIGARREAAARETMLQGFAATFAFAALLGVAGALVADKLPGWLGGTPDITRDATAYFAIFIVVCLPISVFHFLGVRVLQAAGDMRAAGALNVVSCALDVLFNFLFIFPTRTVALAGVRMPIPGLGLGVAGAAWGTVASEIVVGGAILWTLFFRQPTLRLRRGDKLRFDPEVLKRAIRIGLPIAADSAVMTGAMVATTAIVAPLGAIALAANSFAISAESLCYMPGYGISSAATTVVGQSIGAGREALARSLGWTCTALGMATLAITGTLLWIFAPEAMALLSPDPEVCAAGAEVLRIEAFAEPLFGASIVAAGAVRGAGDTLVPAALNAASMWLVRIPLAALLVVRHGLMGAWIAMAIELCVRGALLLARQNSRAWSRPERYRPPPED